MIVLNLDRNLAIPLFKQVFRQLKDLIDRNVLKPGFRMPATRELAEKMAVNRSTIYKAYEELWAQGYLESRPGSYSFVRKRKKVKTNRQTKDQAPISWEKLSTKAANDIHRYYQDLTSKVDQFPIGDIINASHFLPDPRLLPIEDFKRSLNTVLKEKGPDILKYSEAQGYTPLREYIANRMQIHGINVSTKEILITGGSQSGVDLMLKLLVKPGDDIFVEVPTYSAVLPLINLHKANAVGIPMTPAGMDLDALERKLLHTRPAFIYTIPNFHNPTGITTSQDHREELLNICETHEIPLVEDAFEEEMKYFGKIPPSIKSMDNRDITVYLGTFSKVLFPGIRTGWIAAGKECIERLTAVKRFSDISSNLPTQAAMADFCQSGYFELHLKRIHKVYRKRLKTVLKALNTHITIKNVTWTEPQGGYLLWLKLENPPTDEAQLHRLFLDNGVFLSPGSIFFDRDSLAKAHPHCYFRISISALNEDEIQEAVRRIAKVLSKVYGVP